MLLLELVRNFRVRSIYLTVTESCVDEERILGPYFDGGAADVSATSLLLLKLHNFLSASASRPVV